MSQLFNHSLAIGAALFLTLSSIGTIVTVPPANAMSTIGTVTLA